MVFTHGPEFRFRRPHSKTLLSLLGAEKFDRNSLFKKSGGKKVPSEGPVMVDNHQTAAESRVRRRMYDDDSKLME